MQLRARKNKAASCFTGCSSVPVLWEDYSPVQGDKQQPVCLMQPDSVEGLQGKKCTLCWGERPFGSRVLKANYTVASL